MTWVLGSPWPRPTVCRRTGPEPSSDGLDFYLSFFVRQPAHDAAVLQHAYADRAGRIDVDDQGIIGADHALGGDFDLDFSAVVVGDDRQDGAALRLDQAGFDRDDPQFVVAVGQKRGVERQCAARFAQTCTGTVDEQLKMVDPPARWRGCRGRKRQCSFHQIVRLYSRDLYLGMLAQGRQSGSPTIIS